MAAVLLILNLMRWLRLFMNFCCFFIFWFIGTGSYAVIGIRGYFI